MTVKLVGTIGFAVLTIKLWETNRQLKFYRDKSDRFANASLYLISKVDPRMFDEFDTIAVQEIIRGRSM